MSIWAELGRKGGKKTSEAKKHAAKANLRKANLGLQKAVKARKIEKAIFANREAWALAGGDSKSQAALDKTFSELMKKLERLRK